MSKKTSKKDDSIQEEDSERDKENVEASVHSKTVHFYFTDDTDDDICSMSYLKNSEDELSEHGIIPEDSSITEFITDPKDLSTPSACCISCTGTHRRSGIALSSALPTLYEYQEDECKSRKLASLANTTAQNSHGLKTSFSSTDVDCNPPSNVNNSAERDALFPLFIELTELHKNYEGCAEWIERARWIRYEEDVDTELHQWDTPHVSVVCFSDFIQLRRGLYSGAVLLDVNISNMQELFEALANHFISVGQLRRENKHDFIETLLLPHKHEPSYQSKLSMVDLVGRRTPRYKESSSKVNKIDTLFRKNSSFPVSRDKPAEAPTQFTSFQKEKLGEEKFQQELMRRIPLSTEAFAVMIGEVDYVQRPLVAFVRLKCSSIQDHVMELPLPLRYVFVVLGPHWRYANDYYEIGRAMCVLMNDVGFRSIAANASCKHEILVAMNRYMNNCCIIKPPPYAFDREHVNSLAQNILTYSRAMTNRQEAAVQKTAQRLAMGKTLSDEDALFEYSSRTGTPFGAFNLEVKRFIHNYLFFLKSGVHYHCLISLIFMFTVCLSPTFTFAGILAEETEGSFNVNEMLLATSICGIIFALLGGQPMFILGPTGPILVFEVLIYSLCESFEVDLFVVRCWVSFWNLLMCLLILGFEGVFLIKYLTRFTEEIFSMVIALLYLYEAFKWLINTFRMNPVKLVYPYNCTSQTCSLLPNQTDKYICYDCIQPKISYNEFHQPLPNVALMSTILLFGTCALAFLLREIRHTRYFSRMARTTISDLAIFISITCMVLFDYFITHGDSLTKKIHVSRKFEPSAPSRNGSWLINPFRPIPIWVYFATALPALLVFTVVFLETELVGSLIQGRVKVANNGKSRGSGFHMDLLVISFLICLNSILGLPWICVAPVRSLAHMSSLTVYSKTYAPGENPKIVEIIENRYTNVGVHLFLGIMILANFVLGYIPIAALFGVFFYFGLVTMPGTQLFQRMKLIAFPAKSLPYVAYARQVGRFKRNLYTGIQLIAVIVVFVVKITPAAFIFPFVLLSLAPLRHFILPKFFSEKDFEALDNETEQIPDDDVDFYGQIHIPV